MRDYLGRAYGKKNNPRVGYGEIEDIYRRIQKLSGYLNSTIEDIKKIETDPEV